MIIVLYHAVKIIIKDTLKTKWVICISDRQNVYNIGLINYNKRNNRAGHNIQNWDVTKQQTKSTLTKHHEHKFKSYDFRKTKKEFVRMLLHRLTLLDHLCIFPCLYEHWLRAITHYFIEINCIGGLQLHPLNVIPSEPKHLVDNNRMWHNQRIKIRRQSVKTIAQGRQ